MANSSKSNNSDKSRATVSTQCEDCNTPRLITFYSGTGLQHFTPPCVKCGSSPSEGFLSDIRTQLISTGRLRSS